MALQANFANLADASSSVGIEYKTKDLGHEVVKHPAFVWILELVAISTGRVRIVQATLPYLAPGRFLILMTTRTPAA